MKKGLIIGSVIALIGVIIFTIFITLYTISLYRAVNNLEQQLNYNSLGTETILKDDSIPITKEQALQIALNHAQVNENDISLLRIEQEFDDGVSFYEIDFNVGLMQYEYCIDIDNGQIIEFDIDHKF